jgi:drug/metabolite transporter (DMT)-like permease
MFRDKMSYIDSVIIFGCFAITFVIGSYDTSVFNSWTLLFVATVFIQSVSFAAIGNTRARIGTISYVATYNVVGFCVVLLLLITTGTSIFALTAYEWVILAVSGGFGVIASLCAISGLQASSKAKNIAATYVRFPVTLLLAAVLFGEQLSVITISGCMAIVILLWIGGKQRRPIS